MKPAKKNRGALILSLILLIMSASLIAAAAAGTPGSEDDPVVTKSYVDEAISKLKSSLGGTGSAAAWQVVRVDGGKSVVGGTGTQMILRSGSATALDNGSNGVSDLTAGTDLRQGTAVTKDHLLLIPGDDGRGILTIGECYLMINGSYTLK